MTAAQKQAILNLRKALVIPNKSMPKSKCAAGQEIRYLMKLMRRKYAEKQHNVNRCEIVVVPVKGE